MSLFFFAAFLCVPGSVFLMSSSLISALFSLAWFSFVFYYIVLYMLGLELILWSSCYSVVFGLFACYNVFWPLAAPESLPLVRSLVRLRSPSKAKEKPAKMRRLATRPLFPSALIIAATNSDAILSPFVPSTHIIGFTYPPIANVGRPQDGGGRKQSNLSI